MAERRAGSPVIVAEDLVVDYAGPGGTRLRAVDHVSFELHAGEVLGIVGESGSGKSTLGRVVAGFHKPTAGVIRYAGTVPGARPQRHPRGYRDVQMIFQESAAALNPRLPVWRVIGEGLAPRQSLSLARGDTARAVRQSVRDCLIRVGLPESYAAKRATELSGGEKQRVSIARALSARPMAMVCDEAVSALDVSMRAVVLNLFQRLREETGTALFFISHDISVVAHLADRVLVMHDGRAVESGPARDVIENPADVYTQRLIAAVPRLERTGSEY